MCTSELCKLRDAERLTVTENVDLFGISSASCYVHQRFIQENDLSFPLGSDTRGEVTDAYGVAYEEWDHHEGVPMRALFIIDHSDTVRYTWVAESAYEAPSLSELHQAVISIAPNHTAQTLQQAI